MQPLHTLPSSRHRAGFTFIELSVAMTVLLVALLIFSGTVSGMAKQRAINRENALAVTAARNMLETLRAEDFAQVFRRYNAVPGDDPDGAGTGAGNLFAVPGLDALPDASGGMQGEVLFPTMIGANGLELREDVVDRVLGMPRDLSGDNTIDDQDHAQSYFILPVEVRVRWTGPNGPREYTLATQLCRYKKT